MRGSERNDTCVTEISVKMQSHNSLQTCAERRHAINPVRVFSIIDVHARKVAMFVKRNTSWGWSRYSYAWFHVFASSEFTMVEMRGLTTLVKI